MKKRLATVTAAMSFSLAITAVIPTAVFAEETTEAEETTLESESESETEAEPFDYSAGYDSNGFFEGVKALDYVTLPEYIGVSIADTNVIPLESEIQEQIDSIIEQYTTTENETEGTVQDGDTINIDFVGSIDGEEFEGGTTDGNGTNVTIGVTNYIDDFLEQLIGHEVGETINVEVTFPDDYKSEDKQGKDAVFVTTINYIVKTNVPEFNDEFVSEYLDVNTAEEYKQSIYDKIYESNLINELLSWVLENAEVSEVPESAVQTYYDYQYEYLNNMGAAYGYTAETILSIQGMTEDDLKVWCESYVSQLLILQAIMEDAGLEVSEEFMIEAAGGDADTYEFVIEYYGENYVKSSMIPERVGRFMLESAQVYEAEETETEAESESESEYESESESEYESESETSAE